MISQFHPFSIGIAAENKPLETKNLKVVPIELVGNYDGEINTATGELSYTGVDQFGKESTVTITASNSIECEWFPWGTNRTTAPDVRRGERIHIYRFADSDRYYWVCPGLDDELRRLETIIFKVSDNPDGTSNDPLTADNSYLFEVSTHKKIINIHTSQSNSEPVGYDIQLDTENGVFTLIDTLQNGLQLDSQNLIWELINGNETQLMLNKENVSITAKGQMDINVGKDCNIACANLNISASSNITMQCSAWICTADSFAVNSPTATFSGAVTAQSVSTGSLQTSSMSSAGGGGGTLNIDAAVVATQPITAPSFNQG